MFLSFTIPFTNFFFEEIFRMETETFLTFSMFGIHLTQQTWVRCLEFLRPQNIQNIPQLLELTTGQKNWKSSGLWRLRVASLH